MGDVTYIARVQTTPRARDRVLRETWNYLRPRFEISGDKRSSELLFTYPCQMISSRVI